VILLVEINSRQQKTKLAKSNPDMCTIETIQPIARGGLKWENGSENMQECNCISECHIGTKYRKKYIADIAYRGIRRANSKMKGIVHVHGKRHISLFVHKKRR
jgi:hypothetical protein